MRIAFFGGSFDPIHLGHLHLANEMMKSHHLHKIYFSPAYLSPHRKDFPPVASAEDRMQMVELALQDHKGFIPWDYEIKQGGISYTVDALKALKKIEDSELFFILSADAMKSFSLWKDPEVILSFAKPLIGRRDESVIEFPQKWQKIFEEGYTENRVIEISSTLVRSRIKKGEDASDLLPPKVLDYILSRRLYS